MRFLSLLFCLGFLIGASQVEGQSKPESELPVKPFKMDWRCYKKCMWVVKELCAFAPPPAQPSCLANGKKLCWKVNTIYQWQTIGTIKPTKGTIKPTMVTAKPIKEIFE